MNLYKKLPAVFPVLTFLLIFSFCALLSCTFSLSAEADAALSHAKSLSPLSLPDAVLTPCVCPDEETLSDLSDHFTIHGDRSSCYSLNYKFHNFS